MMIIITEKVKIMLLIRQPASPVKIIIGPTFFG